MIQRKAIPRKSDSEKEKPVSKRTAPIRLVKERKPWEHASPLQPALANARTVPIQRLAAILAASKDFTIVTSETTAQDFFQLVVLLSNP
jgi:hypothetical protein